MTVLLSGFNFLLCIFSSIDFYIHFRRMAVYHPPLERTLLGFSYLDCIKKNSGIKYAIPNITC